MLAPTDQSMNDATLGATYRQASMQRRRFLTLGLGATAALALAGGGFALVQPGLEQGRLTAAGRAVFSAVARAVLDGSWPLASMPREQAVQAHLLRLDEVLAAFPSAMQSELSQLLAILAAAPGRIGLAGLRTGWAEADVPQLQQALQGMRTSSLAIRQQAYHALRDLTNAAYYADPQAWQVLGYPGPRVL
ncbi:MAG TPA: hypothetical protein VHQ87_15680 [Rhizobacter sp.]|nr:hypothetical protein [Rhizobacter sp.]